MLGGDGVCDAACNTTSCLWDAGDCKDVLEGVLKEAGLAQADVLRSSRIGELIADEGGYLKQAPAAQYVGVLVGLGVGLCSACVLCYLRRKRRRLQLASRKYTPMVA